ncbi:DUF3137 domain-containing protein [Photobacterium nomapromontoriensis]|uniref:DUF3137 domain-containing protein n=1 Tax=Photobacterium nomapromontoriensis TaxID=2910237 RepID=UPI003D0BC9FA
MHRNRIVAKNIEQLTHAVNAATTQDDLLAVITQVEHHPGPLDYRDPIMHIIKWLMVTSCVLILFLAFIHNDYEWAELVVTYLVRGSCFWLPVVLGTVLMNYFYEKGKYPIPTGLNVLILIAAMVAVAKYAPDWPEVYWDGVYGFGYLLSVGKIDSAEFTFMMILVSVTFGLWMWLSFRTHWRNDLSDRIFLLDALFNNNIKEVKFSSRDKINVLKQHFREFVRGSGSQDMLQLCEGEYQGEEHQFTYRLFHFNYYITKNKTVSDGKGGYETKTEHEYHDRYGILLDFPYASDVCIDSTKKLKQDGIKYLTESTEFNDSYNVQTGDELSTARFLNPAIVIKLLDVNNRFFEPTVEISRDGRLCISSESKLISAKRKHGLADPTAFHTEIAGHTELVKLKEILDVAHDLMRLCDNNFKTSL